MKARSKDIFQMKHIFIPIFYGNRYMCLVISMEEQTRRIDYYDSLNANQTKSRGENKDKLKRSILQAVLRYLQEKHVKLNKDGDFFNEWKTNPLWSAPQQTNRIDCGVFVCMYIDVIHNCYKLGFAQKDIINGGWQKMMMLLIMPDKSCDKDKDKDSDLEVIQINQKPQI
jgi:Ulp1 family protease